MRLSKRW